MFIKRIAFDYGEGTELQTQYNNILFLNRLRIAGAKKPHTIISINSLDTYRQYLIFSSLIYQKYVFVILYFLFVKS